MEVVAASPGGGGMSPFHNHDVREWSRLDSLTGVLERARLETDHWTANTANSSHKYGKVVDSRERSDSHGKVQQQAKRQLEVFQSNIPGGHLQVIKTHTVSSSRWTGNSITVPQTPGANDTGLTSGILRDTERDPDFEDLKLSLNPLDVTSQKSKASVGRSVGRRPPSRPRVREEAFSSTSSHTQHTTSRINNPHVTAAVNLHRVSRLCHQIHEEAVKQAFKDRRQFFHRPTKAPLSHKNNERFEKPPIHERESGDGVEIVEIESSNTSDFETNHSKLTRTKSSSSEDLHLIYDKDKGNKSIEDLQDLEQLQNWRRTSKLRRSLQFPKQNKPIPNKPPDLPGNTGSVKRIKEDLETGRRLSTALRGNNINLQALDQILQSISSSSSVQSDRSDKPETPESDTHSESKKEKRHSFVTVESLQEVKGRLRRTSCQSDDIYKEESRNNSTIPRKEEETDDGIGAEDFNNRAIPNGPNNVRVRSYVYGLETMLNKKPILGTGSLESRTSKQTNSNSIIRNDDWYNRRKSYGFEKVHNEQDTDKIVSLKGKGAIESSTDSGICKSNDTVNLPPTIRINGFKSSDSDNELPTPKSNNGHNDCHSVSVGSVKRFSSIFEQNKKSSDYSNSWNRNIPQKLGKDLEGTTVTIPIKIEPTFRRQLSTPSVTVNSLSNVKRHSIAVDEMKYVNNSFRINEAADENTDEDNPNFNSRKPKKVGFCKTEVHFAPDSGKINIIATDEKPPPTNSFRRRRRNSSSSYVEMIEECNKKGVPTLHFGDNYEKDVLQNSSSTAAQTENTVTVTTNGNIQEYFENSNEDKENSENEIPKGILKNKPVKPKPYILGDIDNSLSQSTCTSSSNGNEIWGVKLKPVSKEEAPMWKSTVTLKNTTFENENNSSRSPKNERIRRSSNENVEKIRIVSSESDESHRKAKLNYPDGNQKSESKGFSTKVNIGGSGSAFVPNSVVYNGMKSDNHNSTWPKKDDSIDHLKRQMYNRSLVVRIGQTDKPTSQQMLFDNDCDNSSNKTTTKITIDLTPPSPTTEKTYDLLKKLPITGSQQFKSTSLILNTFKTDIYNVKDNVQRIPDTISTIPEQLEALKRLYEEALSDSEADKEVQLLMNQNGYDSDKEIHDECNSVVSGSWSRLRAYKIMNKSHLGQKTESALIEKDSRSQKSLGRIEYDWENFPHSSSSVQTQVPLPSNHNNHRIIQTTKNSHSSSTTIDKEQSTISPTSKEVEEHFYETISNYKKNTPPSQEKIYENNVQKTNVRSQNHRQLTESKNIINNRIRDKSSRSPSPRGNSSTAKTPPPIACVVRNLRKSDMKYFGLKECTPPPIPDKFLKKKSNPESPQTSNVNRRLIPSDRTTTKKEPSSSQKSRPTSSKYKPSSNAKSPQRYKQKSPSPHRKSVSPNRKPARPESPIYENIDEVLENSKTYSTDFDSSILDELTKAADQILQAVSDYADEESFNKLLSDDELKNLTKAEKLETISESKSWHQQNTKSKTTRSKDIKTVKRASSTSSVESVPERRNSINTNKKYIENDKYRKKSTESPAVRAATKARRLQRASSREALLLSHGSSSEDLPIKSETPPRKSRVVKKTKCSQLKITNGLDIQKRATSVKNYSNRISSDEKATVAALPEIRHKTAISTIRSTAEKMACRDKGNKSKPDDRKKASLLSSSRKESVQEVSKSVPEVIKQRNIKMKSKKR